MFSKLRFPSGYEITPIPWIPNLPGESLQDYAGKIIAHYNMEEGQVLIGLSLGGIVGGIIHDMLPQNTTIIVSSIAHAGQLPVIYRLPGLLGMATRMINGTFDLKPPLHFLMQPEGDEETALVDEYAKTISKEHLLWVFREVLAWKKKVKSKSVVQIHGTTDRVFPFLKNQCDYSVEHGGHFMILNRHEEMNRIIEKILAG